MATKTREIVPFLAATFAAAAAPAILAASEAESGNYSRAAVATTAALYGTYAFVKMAYEAYKISR